MSEDHQNGWNEYSRLVLKELETLTDGIEGLRDEFQSVKQEIAKMQVREDKVNELRDWKERVDEIYSPSQMKDLREQVAQLEKFKTKAVTVFAVIQFAMALALFLQKMF
jgi:predicted nuclease with TOPRIM domain